ncbi:RdRP-domain-containing protein [Amylocystis lapponica]|nr:RdRP-domain-containing protein [Amylocystis lapponica]
MELELADIPFEATVWDVKRALGEVLHSDEFFNPTDPKDRPLNFQVKLNPGRGGVQNNGHGTLVLPNRKTSDKFMRWLHEDDHSVRVDDHSLRFFRSKKKPPAYLTLTLEKTPYLDPNIEEELEDTLNKLDVGLHVDKVQFGVFYRQAGDSRGASRVFSKEFEISHKNKGAGLLSFEYEHKLIRIEAMVICLPQLGDTMTEEIANNIAITFSNIRKIAIGFDFGNPFVCFELITPPMLERQRINREFVGDEWKDQRKFRQRISSINEAHAVVAPYAHQLRLILHQEHDIRAFASLCKVAGLQIPIFAKIEALSCGFFTPRQLYNARTWIRTFDWSVGFQLEALLHNALLNTDDLLKVLHKPIVELYNEHRDIAGDHLRHFTEALRTRDPYESPLECFNRVRPRSLGSKPLPLPAGMFMCHHVTFTPTRVILEGPYVIQSNRVIRRYPDHQEFFIRVDFRDEDRLQYRWSRDVDGRSLLQERVGGILKDGFELAGRDFEFLAYSSSALREHAVWFMHPFDHPAEGRVTGQTIRDSLGDFSGVIRQPSKYAARIAQAFTATDPSVAIRRDQWEEMEDLSDGTYEFTDGIGTISVELGDMIWEALCKDNPNRMKNSIKPSAYQIRFLGYKGMVSIDSQLQGIRMRPRKSMNKFQAHDEDLADIEIAASFIRPGTCYLNRPLVMILEDRGVEKQAFINLQEKVKREIYTSTDSIKQSITLLKSHQLGGSYQIRWLLECLEKVGMGMKNERSVKVLQDPFIDRVVHYAKNDILRDIKHRARIPIPDSYLLAGVADEGPAYEKAGYKDVLCLDEGQVYVCVQYPEDPEPTYLKGAVVICRSPVVHPGDVQRVLAIGKPPPDKLCLFRNLKNVVVFPCVGKRSLASCLGGGDLDGDTYSVIKYGPLLPTAQSEAASYIPPPPTLLDRDSTVEDICDFVVEYLNSDVLGLLSVNHLIIADQSKYGTNDPDCLELARLCSQAVDYPKNGVAVDIHDSPRFLIKYKPDWKQAEDADPRPTDYYVSDRALGELFRNISISMPETPSLTNTSMGASTLPPLSDSISIALKPYIERQLHFFYSKEKVITEVRPLFDRYVAELRYICMTHALSDAPDVRLVEEEVVAGTIMAQCSQQRWRSDRMYRMRLHSKILVEDIQQKLFSRSETPTMGELRYGLTQAWHAWDFSTRNKTIFGASSFGLIALGVIFNTLERLGGFELSL